YANYRKKECQKGCGIYCAISTSLILDNPVKVITDEVVSRAKRLPALIRESARRDAEMPTAASVA
nr:hypothetical protein [Verrucomicrobiota bacterium]